MSSAGAFNTLTLGAVGADVNTTGTKRQMRPSFSSLTEGRPGLPTTGRIGQDRELSSGDGSLSLFAIGSQEELGLLVPKNKT